MTGTQLLLVCIALLVIFCITAIVAQTYIQRQQQVARRKAIIRHLPAVETLGSTTVICSDKTGTLTENAMTVRVLWCGGEGYALSGHGYSPEGDIRHDEMAAEMGGALRECLVAGALCNDASLRSEHGRWLITGDPTEAALLVAARKGGLDEHTLNALLPRVDVLPFDACRQYMATAHAPDGEHILYVKGALERLLPLCVDQLASDGRSVPLDASAIEHAAQAYAEQGMRVLLLARRLLPEAAPAADLRVVLARNAELIPRFVTDWRGVTDPAGQPMPISALPAVLTGPYGKAFSVGLNRAIAELRYGVAPDGESVSRGNSAPPPAAGSTADAAAVEEPTI